MKIFFIFVGGGAGGCFSPAIKFLQKHTKAISGAGHGRNEHQAKHHLSDISDRGLCQEQPEAWFVCQLGGTNEQDLDLKKSG